MGDPVKGVRAIIEAVEAPHPPLHLVLGSDSLERSRANVARLLEDMDHWEHASRETAFEAGLSHAVLGAPRADAANPSRERARVVRRSDRLPNPHERSGRRPIATGISGTPARRAIRAAPRCSSPSGPPRRRPPWGKIPTRLPAAADSIAVRTASRSLSPRRTPKAPAARRTLPITGRRRTPAATMKRVGRSSSLRDEQRVEEPDVVEGDDRAALARDARGTGDVGSQQHCARADGARSVRRASCAHTARRRSAARARCYQRGDRLSLGSPGP